MQHTKSNCSIISHIWIVASMVQIQTKHPEVTLLGIELCNTSIQHKSINTIQTTIRWKIPHITTSRYARPICLHRFLWESMCNVTHKIMFLMLPRCSWILLPIDWYKYRSDVLKYNIVLINCLCSQKSAGMCGQVWSRMRDVVGTQSTGTDCASYAFFNKSKIQTLITVCIESNIHHLPCYSLNIPE